MAEIDATRACVVCGVLFPRDGKREICSAVCVANRQVTLARDRRAAMAPVTTCGHCLMEIKGRLGRRYCDAECRRQHHIHVKRMAHGPRDTLCAWCASPFTKSHGAQAYCSSKCAKAQERSNAAARAGATYHQRADYLSIQKAAADKRRADRAKAAEVRTAEVEARRKARADQRAADAQLRLSLKRERGQAASTLSLKARPDAYAHALSRWRAKSLKRKTGKAMPSDGTATAAVMLGGAKCLYCNCGLTDANRTHDHMTPLVHGGVHSAANIAACCLSCNSSKGSRSFAEFVAALPDADRRRAVAYFEKRNGRVDQGQLQLAA